MEPNIVFPFPKGSLWRKWDLQMHCPEDVLQNGFEGKDSAEKWDKYLSAIEKTDLEVIGITNYFCLKGYREILGQKRSGRIPNIKLILPNIEFRISQPNKAGEYINIHIIFSENERLIGKIENFLNRLPLLSTAPDKISQYCSDDHLRTVGYDKALVEITTLNSQLEKDFEPLRDYLIIGVPRGLGSFRPAGEEGRGITVAIEIDKIAHAFYGKEDDAPHFLNIQRYENAIPKPVIASSDAHRLEDIGSRFSWIKADPSFEGLKQIVFEPQERIKIQEEKPEEKKTYYLIDKVRFIDNNVVPVFAGEYIEINSNLTTIIGGRSTGKSLLMHYIAKTIDRQEVSERSPEGNKYKFDDDPDFNFEVIWSDGENTLLRSQDEEFPSDVEKRKILYLPQNYLNRLSEVDIKSKDTLNQFVINVILQDEKVEESYQQAKEEIKLLSKGISARLNELFSIKTEIGQLEEELRQLGDPKGIESYLKKLEAEAGDIKTRSGLSDSEITTYESLVEREKALNTTIANLNADQATIANLRRDLLSLAKNILDTKLEYTGYINDQEISTNIKVAFQGIENLDAYIKKAIKEILEDVEEKTKNVSTELANISKKLVPLTAKIKLQAELKKKTLLINNEHAKIDKISRYHKTLRLKNEGFIKKREEIMGFYKDIYLKYEDVRNHLKIYENKFEDISLSIVIGFNDVEFNSRVVNDYLNKPTLKKALEVNWHDEFGYQYDPIKHIGDIDKIFTGILTGTITVLRNRTQQDALAKLLENRFYLDFGIAYKGDPLDKMSPGKKGLVLLKLLIELSDDEWPILLDQPDDDLDNRSIYTDLVSFLLRKKKKRQIIAVTHNPNLVVGADSDETIVANQAGQETGRDNRKYRFEYVSGALENSFELDEKVEKAVLYRKGIRQHVCEILEGGKVAFQKRERRYSFHK